MLLKVIIFLLKHNISDYYYISPVCAICLLLCLMFLCSVVSCRVYVSFLLQNMSVITIFDLRLTSRFFQSYCSLSRVPKSEFSSGS